MADLLDIAPSTAVEVVRVNGIRLVVRGLHANDIAHIAARFPQLVSLFGGGGDLGSRLIQQFGEAIGPIIAAGCGHRGNEEREKIASTLLLEDQLDLLKAIIGLTFPNGFGSFVSKITALLAGVGEGAKIYKVRLKKSPSQSAPSSDEASRPIMQ